MVAVLNNSSNCSRSSNGISMIFILSLIIRSSPNSQPEIVTVIVIVGQSISGGSSLGRDVEIARLRKIVL